MFKQEFSIVIEPGEQREKNFEMWTVVICFVLPAFLFSLLAIGAWLRMIFVKRRRCRQACVVSSRRMMLAHGLSSCSSPECNGHQGKCGIPIRGSASSASVVFYEQP